MTYSLEKINIMQHLGTGLSVDNLCRACDITYNHLCELAQEHMDLYHELKKWYKRFDFVPETKNQDPKPLESKETLEDKPKKVKKKVETK